jgi:hypothetical protein
MANKTQDPTTPKRRLLVTGIGRSGTGYVAKLLTEAGLPCGHESIYTANTTRPPDWGDRLAESSWFAAPWIHKLPEGTSVVHLVRNPIDWCASWVGTVWPPRGSAKATMNFLETVTDLPWTKLIDQDRLDAAMRLWVQYNQYVGTSICRLQPSQRWFLPWRVEDPTTSNIEHCLGAVGAEITTGEAYSAQLSVPKDVNSRPHRKLKLAECVFRPWYTEMMRSAARYGYPDPWKGTTNP